MCICNYTALISAFIIEIINNYCSSICLNKYIKLLNLNCLNSSNNFILGKLIAKIESIFAKSIIEFKTKNNIHYEVLFSNRNL